MAAAIGTGPVADAFFVAQRLPNLFRRLFAEGAFASAFVPLFTKAHEGEGPEAGRKFAEESLAALAFALLLLTIVAEFGMVWLTFALAPGFAAEPDKFELAVLFSRITFPYLLLISIAALLSGALNGINRFLAAALAPVLLNLSMIVVLFFIWWSGEVGTVDRHLAVDRGDRLRCAAARDAVDRLLSRRTEDPPSCRAGLTACAAW